MRKTPNERRRLVGALALLVMGVCLAGCATAEQRAFLLRHAEKVGEYVTAVEMGPMALSDQAVEESQLPPERKALLRSRLDAIRRRSQDLLLDAATIERIWGG